MNGHSSPGEQCAGPITVPQVHPFTSSVEPWRGSHSNSCTIFPVSLDANPQHPKAAALVVPKETELLSGVHTPSPPRSVDMPGGQRGGLSAPCVHCGKCRPHLISSSLDTAPPAGRTAESIKLWKFNLKWNPVSHMVAKTVKEQWTGNPTGWNECRCKLCNLHQITQNYSETHFKCKLLNIIEENIAENWHELWVLTHNTNRQSTKKKQGILWIDKIKDFYSVKDLIQKSKRQVKN